MRYEQLAKLVVAGTLVGCGSSSNGPSEPSRPSATVHLVGRFDVSDASAPRFSFPGSRVVTRFDGTTLSVRLNEAGPNQYSVRVDGTERPVLKTQAGSQVYTLVSELPAGEHELVLTRRTEAFFGVTQLLGFEGAPLVATAWPYTRFIEFVGDSITCGYGVLGDVETCPFTPDTESEPHAYGALAAEALGAGHTAIAYSGKGVVANNGGDPSALMPEIFARTLGDSDGTPWSFGAYIPDVVVVNLGTNDFSQGDPGQGFVSAYDAFVKQIRGRYPEAWIVVATSPMLTDAFPTGAMARTRARTYLETVVARAEERGDHKVALVELAEQQAADGYGCDWHPNAVTQEKMAQALVDKLRALTGW